jgi:hypothetical protein
MTLKGFKQKSGHWTSLKEIPLTAGCTGVEGMLAWQQEGLKQTFPAVSKERHKGTGVGTRDVRRNLTPPSS